MPRISLLRVAMGVLLGLILWVQPAAAASKLILALGDGSYIRSGAVKGWTGAEVKRGLGKYELVEFAVVILSNISYGGLPEAVRGGLSEYLSRGGSLLITGGPNAYGSGGYQAMADLIPFEIRGERDWRAVPFKPVIPLQTGHPILSGVTFQTVGNFNDLNAKPGAAEIAQYAGGGTAQGAQFASPLIVEQSVGQGTVVGVAFDLGQEVRGGWADGTRFVRNLLTYLVERSPLKPKPREGYRGGRR
ncbi:MAG: hypothetical protein ACE5IQ_01885 [Candidatus Methylomirabilales bacterium]